MANRNFVEGGNLVVAKYSRKFGTTKRAVAAVILAILLLLTCSIAAQTRKQGPWWPQAQWGPDDQAGASNWITDAKVLRAVRLVTTGKTYELGHIYERGMPLYGDRTFSLVIPTPFPPSRGQNAPTWFIDYFSGELGQLGTQFDALGHTGMKMKMADGSEKDVFYNGFTRDEINSPGGLRALGVEKARPIITRGILLDIAGYKGVPVLSSRYEVTVADVRGALAKQGLREESIEAGDAILFNYGWRETGKIHRYTTTQELALDRTTAHPALAFR